MKKVIGLLAVALLLGACGGNDSNNDAENSGNEKLTVGMECNYAPFNWTDPQSNDFNVEIGAGEYCDGYDVQIAKNIADALGRDLVIRYKGSP